MNSMFRLTSLALALTALTGFAQEAAAAYSAVGVQNDVNYSDVVNGGWTVVYRGDYGTPFTLDSVFGSIAAGSNVMLAGIQTGSTSVFDVLAYATKEEVLQLTPHNATHFANGANWYFNNESMGFAGAGDTIFQYSADGVGSGQGWAPNPNGLERDRLSWHTGGNANGTNITVEGGWRSGTNIYLNSAPSGWDRMVLVQAAAVPEPETHAMLLAGLGVLGFMGKRRKTQ